MEAGKAVVVDGVAQAPTDLITAISASASPQVDDSGLTLVERSACPTCGSCSGMFTANSMNCLTEALGLALPGNGSTLATHAARRELFLQAGRTVMDLCRRWYSARRRERAAAQHRHAGGVRERDGARRRHGRLDEHRAAHPGRRAGGRGRLRPRRDRRDLPARAVPEQGLAELGLPHGRRPPGRRHPGDPRRAVARWPARRGRQHGALPLARGVAVDVGRAGRGAVGDRRRAVPRRAGRGAHHRGVLHGEPLELTGHGRRGRLHPRRRARLHRGRRAGRAPREHRPGRRGDQDGGHPRGAVALRGPGAGRREPGGGRLGRSSPSRCSPAT